MQFRLAIAALLTRVVVAFDTVAGLYANSLALLTNAAHNLIDVAIARVRQQIRRWVLGLFQRRGFKVAFEVK